MKEKVCIRCSKPVEDWVSTCFDCYSGGITLGDIVKLRGSGNTYSEGTVKKVNEDGTFVVFRPYVHTADFSYTGGIICYVGIEEYTTDEDSVDLVKKGPKLK